MPLVLDLHIKGDRFIYGPLSLILITKSGDRPEVSPLKVRGEQRK